MTITSGIHPTARIARHDAAIVQGAIFSRQAIARPTPPTTMRLPLQQLSLTRDFNFRWPSSPNRISSVANPAAGAWMRINSTRDNETQGDHLLLTWTGIRCTIGALLVIGLAAAPARAQDNALEKFVGRWDVRVKTLQPEKPDLTYIETYEWMLDRKFVRGRTEGKTDGTEDMVVGGYDAKTNRYPFWIFSSSGTYLDL